MIALARSLKVEGYTLRAIRAEIVRQHGRALSLETISRIVKAP